MPARTISPADRRPVEFLYADFAAEHTATRRMLERFPDGRGDWRPHAKSRTLAELATHVASILNTGTLVLQTDELDVLARTPQAPLDTVRALLAHFETGVRAFDAALAATSFDHLDGMWTMRRGDQVLIAAPRRVLLRRLTMNHLVHHRAQLGVYYRLLDVPVPGMYGPSADD
jgi:uncharacterized damage-inducible protein DinB